MEVNAPITKEYRSFYYDTMRREPVTDDFTVASGTVMTPELLRNLIEEHKESRVPRYERLKAAAETRFMIFNRKGRPDYRPDNRLAVDMAKYILDTFTGFYIGVPPRYTMPGDEAQLKWLTDYNKANVQDDVDAELAELSSLYGNSYELLYQGPDGDPHSVALDPIGCFIVYDDSVLHRPLFGIRYYYDEGGKLAGTFSTPESVVQFAEGAQGLEIGEADPHYFGGLPIVEYVENAQKRGVFEGVLNLIEAYNAALSAKADDVEYFADAYMRVTGMKLGDEFKENLREFRVINLWSDDTAGGALDVDFLAKPNGDITQENLLSRLEALIYKVAMVPDISNESFGTASGIALKMRMMPMSNLAAKKDRKFIRSVKRRLELLANYPSQPFRDWDQVEVKMARNFPDDLASEASLASSLSGVVSEETQLGLLSCVDDVQAEIERKRDEQSSRAAGIAEGYPTNRTSREKAMEAPNDRDDERGSSED